MIENLHEIHRRELQQYYDRLLRSNHSIKILLLQQLWKFLHQSPSFSPITELIKSNYNPFWNAANSIFHSEHPQILSENYQDRIYTTYFLIDKILRDGRNPNPMIEMGKKYSSVRTYAGEQPYFDIFNDLFLEPFIYFYLNQADKGVFMLGLLKKYKQRSEWFNKDELLSLSSQSRKGEKLLKQDLCKYIHDQGGELYIEPSSPSGEVDLIAVDNSSAQKALIEGKIFDADQRSKSYIIKGYHQSDTYLKEHGQNKGYFLIYNISPVLLIINANPGISFPYVIRDNRLLYFVIVDLYQFEKSASVRGARDVLELKDADFN